MQKKCTQRFSAAVLHYLGCTFIVALGIATFSPVSTSTKTTSAKSPTPRTDPRAPRLSVMLAGFENRTHDPILGPSLTQALMLEMGQSPFLSILSVGQAADTMNAHGRPARDPVTGKVSLQKRCVRAGAREVLDGAIALIDNHYEIDLKAVKCDTADTVVEERGEAASKRDILQALHKASSELRAKMGEPLASVQKFDVPAERTTSSLEALDDYNLGVAVQRESGDVPSISFFKRALTRDPRFPMADAVLAGVYGNLRQPSLAIEYATKAYELRDRVGERERFHISGVYFLETGQREQEISNYKAWKTEYPGDAIPYNGLGNDYAALGDLGASLLEYQAALRITPSVAVYTNVAAMELELNRASEARTTLDEAFASKLDGRYLHQVLYWVAFVQRNDAQMDRQVAWAAGKPGDEDALLSVESDTEAYYGRVTRARQLTRMAVKSALHAGSKETAALWQINNALREAEVGDAAVAKTGVASALALSRGRDVELMSAFTLARAGDGAEAARSIEALEKKYPTDTVLKLYWLPTIEATIALDAGNSSAALEKLEAVLPYELGVGATFINYVYPAYVRGEAYLHARDPGSAVVEFQKVIDHSGIVVNFVTGALSHLQLGRAFEMAGETAKAKSKYQDFFTLWKGADPNVPVLVLAKAEYAKLQ